MEECLCGGSISLSQYTGCLAFRQSHCWQNRSIVKYPPQ